MNSHDGIYYIAVPAAVSSAVCTAVLSITAYKFQLPSSSDKITHTYAHRSVQQYTNRTRGNEKSVIAMK